MSLNGKKVSEFTADAYLNGEFVKVSDKDLQGKWSVLFFYPADFTLSARLSWKISRDSMAISKEGCEIYSVSCDTHFVHKAWHDSSEKIGKVTYPMIGDPTAQLAKDLDVYIEADGMTERGTFVINPDGEVVLYEISAGNIGRNADELLRKVRAAKFVYEHGDEVCPAKWGTGGGDIETVLRSCR